MVQLNGHCHPDFAPLKSTFHENFLHHGESGAALTVYQHGEPVVQLYGSHNSHHGDWQATDRVCTMSCSKAPLALCLHLLIERGLATLDDPVAKHWPEFAQNGKDTIRIRQVLNHTAGLPTVSNCRNGDIFNWQRMITALEQASPLFPPGEKLAYHALTFGHLVGELIHRIDGRMPGDFFQQEISQPFGIDYDLKVIPGHSIRPIAPHPHFSALPLWFFSKLPYLLPRWKMQYFRPCNIHYHPNSRAWQSSEIPAVTGQGSATGLARLYAFLANGGHLGTQQFCSPETARRLQEVSHEGTELASNSHWRMGHGVMLNAPDPVAFGSSPNAFGHIGMGGATSFADPDNNLSFAYVTEKYHHPHKGDKSMAGMRLKRLIDACYGCIEA